MKQTGLKLTNWSLEHPRTVLGIVGAITVLLMAAAALPTAFPGSIPFLRGATVDTDPENMLSRDEAIRVFHNRMKEIFDLKDMVVVGVVNEKHPDGVFNVESLERVYELTEFAKTLRWPDRHGEEGGVVRADLIAPSTVDNIEPGGPGVVRFEWLMAEPPATAEDAVAVMEKARRIPFLDGTLLSEDGRALAIYLPLTDKHLSYRVYSALREKIGEFAGDDRYYITGLPVAEDTFGVEMFIQMGISAPLAMLVIFLLMLYFFRKVSLIASPLIIAFISVVWTMSLLVITGNTIHIMSSMIPIFIMPIAVLDAIHIISMFFDRYQKSRDRVRTMRDVMDSLFMAMLYTSLTTTAGFASLALTPIPPVQVFGFFSALGIMSAWLLTVTFIPAFVAIIPEEKLNNFGHMHEEGEARGPMAMMLQAFGGFTYRRAWGVVIAAVIGVAIAGYGISKIRINDNPTRWFSKSHPIREADRVLNEHFGGTYMTYLTLSPIEDGAAEGDLPAGFNERLDARTRQLAAEEDAIENIAAVFGRLRAEASGLRGPGAMGRLRKWAGSALDAASDDMFDAWDEALLFVEQEAQRRETFKNPEVLRYVQELQGALSREEAVGKSNSVADIVTTVHRELFEGDEAYMRVPDTQAAVAQCLITYQNSHRPQDLWHLVTSDFRRTSIWVQLRSGDNRDMSQVVEFVKDYMAAHPPPLPLKHEWFGLTYINVIWQEKMVQGMLNALLGSFLVVFLMMTVLFRSALWGLLCMIPLSITIAFTYGAVGLVGKDYDMPVAVLSSLSLGLAVDFAIHFLEHSRIHRTRRGTWKEAIPAVFGDPARAIWRNIVVIAVGFLPLLFAPLIPYKTVGVLMATILVVAGFATLLLLPALMRLLEKPLFPETKLFCFLCKCGTCVTSAAAAVVLVVVSIYRYLDIGLTTMTAASIGAIVVLAGICRWTSKVEKHKLEEE